MTTSLPILFRSGLLALFLLLLTTGCREEADLSDLAHFEDAFRECSSVMLYGIEAESVTAMRQDQEGRYYVVDGIGRQLLKFDAKGMQVGETRTSSSADEEFRLPFDVAVDGRNRVYVVDLNTSRVSIFDDGLRLLHSFLFSAQGFTGTSIDVDSTGTIYLGGLQKGRQAEHRRIIHKYTSEGEHAASFLKADSRIEEMNLRIVGRVDLAFDARDHVYAIQPLSPAIRHFDSEGHLVRTWEHRPDLYRPPVPFPETVPSDRQGVEEILSRWTQANSILSDGSSWIILTFKTHRPIEYVLDFHSLEGEFAGRSVASPNRPEFVGSDGAVYFIPSEQPQSGQLLLTKCFPSVGSWEEMTHEPVD